MLYVLLCYACEQTTIMFNGINVVYMYQYLFINIYLLFLNIIIVRCGKNYI